MVKSKLTVSIENIRPALRTIKRLSFVPAPVVNTLIKSDGTVLVGHEGCRKRLAEYFSLFPSLLLLGSETLSIGTRERDSLNSFSNRALCRIMGYR